MGLAGGSVRRLRSQQSDSSCWSLSDYFLDHQGEITAENLPEKAESFLSKAQGASVQGVKSCIADGQGARIVAHDISAAEKLQVRSTPMLFIDGRQAPGLHSRDDLQRLIERELRVRGSAMALQSRQSDAAGKEQR
jgi:protein-disulfide isomerase